MIYQFISATKALWFLLWFFVMCCGMRGKFFRQNTVIKTAIIATAACLKSLVGDLPKGVLP